MHRHALSRRLADASLRYTLRRGDRSFSRHAAPSSKTPKVEESPVSKELSRVLSPEGCQFLRLGGAPQQAGRAKKAPGRKQPFQPTVAQPSQETELMSVYDPSIADGAILVDDDINLASDDTQRFSAGSLVEIRRHHVSALGVVLFTALIDRQWTVHTLTFNGEVLSHHEQDVQFVIPDFVGKKEAEACGLLDVAATETETDARAGILKHLRIFVKRFEHDLHNVVERAREINLHERISHPDRTTWSFTSTQAAARTIFQGRRDITNSELLAVQTHLMDNGSLYVAEQRRFLRSHRFWVRPRDEVELLTAVQGMCLRNDPNLNAFAEKACTLIEASRRRTAESWNERPSRHPVTDVELTETDNTILRFLRASLRAMRHIQVDPFEMPAVQILKKIRSYEPESSAYSDHDINKLLVETGVLAPWEEAISQEVGKREDTFKRPLYPSTASPLVSGPIRPDGLYSRDLVDSMRHDFGDMPVYVIDDWGAEELDDGVSIESIPSDPEHTWLHVHIADPTTLLPPTHSLARRAFRMATSRYMLDRTIPMLPPSAGFHRFSLGGTPGQPDKTLTFSAKVNSSGDIVEHKVRPAIIRKVQTLKYDTIDEVLGLPFAKMMYPFGQPHVSPSSQQLEPTVIESMRRLERLTRSLMQARIRQGSVGFSLPRPELSLEPRPLPKDIMSTTDIRPHAFRGFPNLVYGTRDTKELGSRLLVAECMKTACRIASLFFRDRGIPALRRVVGPIRSELVDGVEQIMAARDEYGSLSFQDMARYGVSVPPGVYSTAPGPHSLVGIPADEGYVKVTSPLRRFGDVFAHWQIKHALLADADAGAESGVPAVFWNDAWLARMADELEERELIARRLERSRIDFWAHLFLRRWMADPAAGARTEDPLQALTAVALAPAQLNVRTKDGICPVHVPALALQGILVGIPPERASEISAGHDMAVQIRTVMLGVRPVLELSLR